jgi:hypothetical protein
MELVLPDRDDELGDVAVARIQQLDGVERLAHDGEARDEETRLLHLTHVGLVELEHIIVLGVLAQLEHHNGGVLLLED